MPAWIKRIRDLDSCPVVRQAGTRSAQEGGVISPLSIMAKVAFIHPFTASLTHPFTHSLTHSMHCRC